MSTNFAFYFQVLENNLQKYKNKFRQLQTFDHTDCFHEKTINHANYQVNDHANYDKFIKLYPTGFL